MGIFTGIMRRLGYELRATLDNPSTSLEEFIRSEDCGWTRGNTSGVKVTAETILSIPAVWRGINVLCNSVGKLVPFVYENSDDNGQVKAKSHVAYHLLTKQANPHVSARDMRKSLIYHALVYGNGFAFISRNGFGDPVSMQLLPAWDFNGLVTTTSGALIYKFVLNGRDISISADDVFHIKGLSKDSAVGMPVVERLAPALGVVLAEQQYAGTYFGRGVLANMTVEFEPGIKRDAILEALEDLKLTAAGMRNAHGIMVTPPGAKVASLHGDPESTQLIESRTFSVKVVANILGVPPHLLCEGDGTGKSLEAENQSFLDNSLDPWLDAFEDEAERKLLTLSEQKTESHCVEFDRSRLLKADLATQVKTIATLIQWGALSHNEGRQRLGLPPREGGDVYLQPGNMTVSGDDSEEDAPVPNHLAAPMKKPDDATNTGNQSNINRMDSGATDALAAAIWGVTARLISVRDKRMGREKDAEKVRGEIRLQVSEAIAPLLAVRFTAEELEERSTQLLAIWDAPDSAEQIRELLK